MIIGGARPTSLQMSKFLSPLPSILLPGERGQVPGNSLIINHGIACGRRGRDWPLIIIFHYCLASLWEADGVTTGGEAIPESPYIINVSSSKLELLIRDSIMLYYLITIG